MENRFGDAFGYKVIYVIRINDQQHKGLLKIGDATLQTTTPIDSLAPNCKELNQAARERIKQYTNTAGVSWELLHTELAVRTKKSEDGVSTLVPFRDHDVHRVLTNSRIKKKQPNDSSGREWFAIDLQTVLKAIKAVKRNWPNLGNSGVDDYIPIVFRPEQEEAISKTLKQFKTGDRMLWNAKMRFGKTLSALEVVRKAGYAKTIIITHRPVVDSGWYEDFGKIFHKDDSYLYGSKNNGGTIDFLLESGKKFVYFASMQDLRGSSAVGKKYEKNDAIFSLDWDLVIVDEAHEGTTTVLGDSVITKIVKDGNGYNTKFLALSGTPFNILGDYDDNIYTWDYVMEQQRKKEWDEQHFGDSNPYDELPELKIYTYDLGKVLSDKCYVELEDKAFNFREFFRTWTGNLQADHAGIPSGCVVGDFCHEADVWSFLNLVTKDDAESYYPYANEEYRNLFRHSLWMVPGVREARALSKMLKQHPVFGSGGFEVVNVAGAGDEEERADDALEKVRSAIKAAGEDGYTITLSCGKLTTGVTVPEWTAVFMLSGSFSTSAANYLQTIFRVQSPCKSGGKLKRCCYVFDFAPDRTLKMVAEAAALSTKAGKASESDRRIMGEFLNYCPVIAVSGTMMKKYDTNKLLQQLKRAYAERAVQNGFDDIRLYNDELLRLDAIDLERFKDLKGIVGASRAAPKAKEIDINNQGFTDEEYEELERIQRKPKQGRTPEEEEKLKKIKEKQKQKYDAISILRGVSIRMPLLIYGADVDIDEDITIEKLVDIVDDASWDEFMPNGVTKKIFRSFIKYYDPEIFVAAGRKIRNIARSADTLPPMERIQKITALFSCFKNPDKETVLTPWRVVNMHMSDCLGGYDFYDDAHQQTIDRPRFVNQGQVTVDTLANPNAKILEINSKTGLYPLYVAYSIFASRCSQIATADLTDELQMQLWNETVRENVFVICKTPMAKQITRRTLVGFQDTQVNAHYFDDLINMLKHKPKQFTDKVLKANYWNLSGGGNMNFDAVVGNPPYQVSGGSGGTNDAPVYQYFVSAAENVEPKYASLIMPARWFSGGRENLLSEFRQSMLANRGISKMFAFTSSRDIFPSVEIKGGLCYYLYDKQHSSDCEYTIAQNGQRRTYIRNLGDFDVLIREPLLASIVKKVMATYPDTVNSIISNDTPFGIPTNPKASKKNPVTVYETDGKEHSTRLFYIEGTKRKIEYVRSADIKKNADAIDTEKVFIPEGYGAGEGFPHQILGLPEYGGKNSVCSQSYLYAAFNSENEAKNFISYLKTKFFRVLVLAVKISQHAMSKTYRFVPLQDFSKPWTDAELYEKYGLSEEEIAFVEATIKPME